MKIGLLGTGLMGAPMAIKLAGAGYEVTAYNRTPEKLEPLEKVGINTTSNPLEVMQFADCLILMLTDVEVIKKVILTEENKKHLDNKTIIQMGTIAPSHSKAIHQEIVSLGGEYLEAPVLGSIPQVKDGTLLVMVGATPQQFNYYLDLLKNFGPEPMLIGEVSSAATVKLAMNQLIGSLTTAFALSLGLVQKEGIEIDKFMDILRGSALYAPTFDKKLSRMVEGNFSNPNFPSKHLLKDMNLFCAEAGSLGLDVSLVEAVSKVVQKALDLGLANEDYSALFAAVNPQED